MTLVLPGLTWICQTCCCYLISTSLLLDDVFAYQFTNALHQCSTAMMLLSPATALKFCVKAGVYRGISAREAFCHSRMWSPQRLWLTQKTFAIFISHQKGISWHLCTLHCTTSAFCFHNIFLSTVHVQRVRASPSCIIVTKAHTNKHLSGCSLSGWSGMAIICKGE